jgi:Protein of unknown function (DUF2867)
MAVYVKPNGVLGSAYMAAIRPFRRLIVYPPMLREMERNWRAAGALDRTDRGTKPAEGPTRLPLISGPRFSARRSGPRSST